MGCVSRQRSFCKLSFWISGSRRLQRKLLLLYNMYSDAKVVIFLHIPILFSNYLMDSYHFQGLKGSTSCYFMRILWSIQFHTPSLFPSPARGMFRFGDMVSSISSEGEQCGKDRFLVHKNISYLEWLFRINFVPLPPRTKRLRLWRRY